MTKVENYDKREEEGGSTPVRSKKAAGKSSADLGSNSGTRSTSRSTGDNALGISREDWQGELAILFASFSGGILNRLMQQAEDQLENANACIEWYEREKQRAEQAIRDINELQNQLLPTETEEAND